MDEKRLVINDIDFDLDLEIEFGKTTLRGLKRQGFEYRNIEQPYDDPVITDCELWYEGEKIAKLQFYNIKATVNINKLEKHPIDYGYEEKREKKIIVLSFKSKLLIGMVAHLAVCGLFGVATFFMVNTQEQLEVSIVTKVIFVLLLFMPTTIITISNWLSVVKTEEHRIKKAIILLNAVIQALVTLIGVGFINNWISK